MIRTQSLQTERKLIVISLSIVAQPLAKARRCFPSYFGYFREFFHDAETIPRPLAFTVSRSFSSTLQRRQLALRGV
jgi:hypothetical protein